VPMKLLLVDSLGRPVDKVPVRVISPGSYVPLTGQTLTDPRARRAETMSNDLAVTYDQEIYLATSDAGGQCIVYGIRDRHDLILGLGSDRLKLRRIGNTSFGASHLAKRITLERK